MKYLLKGINEINETLKAIDDIDRYYFGKVDDSTTRQFKDNQFGYYEVEVGPYDDEYTFHPYNDQERMKTIYNTLNIVRKDFSERCLELHKKAVEKLEYSIKNNLEVI